ncbi:hypothetical protein BGX24_008693 [Mortierella sp. AD032]|nr:hypothetical protein BGX24_008693 [Mortierella sp. AD032]
MKAQAVKLPRTASTGPSQIEVCVEAEDGSDLTTGWHFKGRVPGHRLPSAYPAKKKIKGRSSIDIQKALGCCIHLRTTRSHSRGIDTAHYKCYQNSKSINSNNSV